MPHILIPKADFIRFVHHSDEDAWLRPGLCQVAAGHVVQVHRYVRRGDDDVVVGDNDNEND